MKITKLQAENFKRLRAIEIQPGADAAVVVGGRNGQGKSSVLDTIQAAFGGLRQCPGEPIRRGSKSASIVVTTDELEVTRVFHKRGSRLEVRARDGVILSSPQQVLDRLYGALTFDPLAFARLDVKKQAEVVRQLAGLDFAELEAERAKLFAERTDKTREYKRQRAVVESMPVHDDAPDEEVDVELLVSALAERRRQNEARDELRRRADVALADRRAAESARDAAAKRLERLQEQVAAAAAELRAAEEAETQASDAEVEHARALEGTPSAAVAEAEAALAAAGETNRRVRERAAREVAAAALKQLETEGKALTAAIEQLDERKVAALEAAQYPVEGLSVDDEGIRLAGLPWDQASSAEQLRCSVAMGLALNPELRVMLIRDGSLLDPDSLAAVAKMAGDAGAQIWIERVSDGEECTVVIEDGAVVGDE